MKTLFIVAWMFAAAFIVHLFTNSVEFSVGAGLLGLIISSIYVENKEKEENHVKEEDTRSLSA